MTATLKPERAARYLAPKRANRDGKQYDCLVGLFSSTPAGAREKLRTAIASVIGMGTVMMRNGHEAEFNRAMRVLDDIRSAGPSIELSPSLLMAIETRDAADEQPRMRYALDPSLDNARAAKAATDAAIEALRAFNRGLCSEHPELGS